jgi:hypothetical protein
MSYYLIYSALEKYDEAVENLNKSLSGESDSERLAYSLRLALDKFVREKGRKPGEIKEVVRKEMEKYKGGEPEGESGIT